MKNRIKDMIVELPLHGLIVLGLLASGLSFVYWFIWQDPFKVVYWLIGAIDLLLFAVSVYRIVEAQELSRAKTAIFTFLGMLFFLVFCEVVVFCATDSEHSLELFYTVLRFAWYLSPSLILLLPIIWLIAEGLG